MEVTQARFDHLEKEVGRRNKVIATLTQQLADAKGELAIWKGKAEGTYGLAKIDLENQVEEAKKREGALRKALEFYADKNNYPLGAGNVPITVVEDSGAKARAALEVK